MGKLKRGVDLTLAVCQTTLAAGVHAKLPMEPAPLLATVEADTTVRPNQESDDNPEFVFPRVLVARDSVTLAATVSATQVRRTPSGPPIRP